VAEPRLNAPTPMSLRSWILVCVGVTLASCGSGGGGSGPPDDSSDPGTGSTTQEAVRDRINSYRAQQSTNAVGLRLAVPLNQSATTHAAYQAIQGEPGYVESTDGLITSPPDTAAPFFSGRSYLERAVAAYTAYNLANNSNLAVPALINERIPGDGSATAAGTVLVDHLWRGIYGRLPLMQQEYDRLGYGDRSHAVSSFGSASVPAAGDPMATLTIGQTGSVARVVAGWPTSVAPAQPGAYDPIGDAPVMTPLLGRGLLGLPIHYIHPTARAWSTFITAEVTRGVVGIDGGFVPVAPAVACLVVASSGNGDGAGLTVIPANALRLGEVFLVPPAPLVAGTWQWRLDATLVGGETASLTIRFRAQ
jgi:hypothetical protein